MATIKGMDRHIKRLQNMRKAAKQVTGALYAAGQDIELDAEHSITQALFRAKDMCLLHRDSRRMLIPIP